MGGLQTLVVTVIVTEPIQLVVVIRVVVRIHGVAPVIIGVSAVTRAAISAHIRLLSCIRYLPFLPSLTWQSAALWARTPKPSFATVPPNCRASRLWILPAASFVIGFEPPFPFPDPLLIFISSGVFCFS